MIAAGVGGFPVSGRLAHGMEASAFGWSGGAARSLGFIGQPYPPSAEQASPGATVLLMADQSQTLRVPLSRGLVALIDPEDAHLLAYTWHALKANRGYYAVRNCRAADGRRGTIYMHREILGIQDPCIRADHKSGDRLDNRRANLRAVTVSVNGRNRGGVPSNNNSGHLGVTWCPRSLRWRAYIGVNGRTSFLGVFRDLQEAVKARARAELTHWGVEPQREAALKAAIAQEGA